MSTQAQSPDKKVVSRLKKLKSEHGKWVPDVSGQHVYHVTSPHVLIQAVGYVKYMEAKSGGRVLCRGQEQLYPTLRPALYRTARDERGKCKRDQALAALLRSAPEKCTRSVPLHARPALLQHYGIKTSWLDVVDNVWVALWFACHRATVMGRKGEFVHFDQRVPSRNHDFAYILLIRADEGRAESDEVGMWKGDNTELVDLRLACPSHYLRPHAQHGLAVRRAGGFGFQMVDYSDLVVGVVRVDLQDAIAWLGGGTLLSVRALFPPPALDFGYGILLDGALETTDLLGAVSMVGA